MGPPGLPPASSPACVLVAIVAVLATGAAYARTYDFDDAYYNQQLLDQVDDALRPWRYEKDDGEDRRERPRFRHKVCCGRYDEASLLQQDTIREQCYLETFNTTRPLPSGEGQSWNQFNCAAGDEVKTNIYCVHQCLWRLRGAVNEENEISVSKLRQFFKDSDSMQWRQELLDAAAVKCISEYQEDRRHEPEGVSCSPLQLDLSYCIWEELQATCPDEHWNTKSRYCNKLRGHIRSRRRVIRP